MSTRRVAPTGVVEIDVGDDERNVQRFAERLDERLVGIRVGSQVVIDVDDVRLDGRRTAPSLS